MISSYFLPILTVSFVAAGLGSQPQHRIIAGRDIDIEEAPWQVSLQVNDEHYCGGSLYSDRIIITAAHCFYQIFRKGNEIQGRPWHTKQFLVLAGSEIRKSRKNLAAVKEKKHHEKVNIDREAHDIGIMTLFKPFSISSKIRPIRLAIHNPAPGTQVLLTGWGLTYSPSPGIPNNIPENLPGIIIYIEYFDESKKYFSRMERHTICARIAGRSACRGDSGGPLVFNNTLVGVVSVGTEKCDGPVMYTSMAYYHKWLINAIKSISNEKVRSGNG